MMNTQVIFYIKKITQNGSSTFLSTLIQVNSLTIQVLTRSIIKSNETKSFTNIPFFSPRLDFRFSISVIDEVSSYTSSSYSRSKSKSHIVLDSHKHVILYIVSQVPQHNENESLTTKTTSSWIEIL